VLNVSLDSAHFSVYTQVMSTHSVSMSLFDQREKRFIVAVNFLEEYSYFPLLRCPGPMSFSPRIHGVVEKE
jgi:hypothetical protein